MKIRDIAAVLLVVSIWGFNFVVVKVGLREVPPLLLGALRFLLVAFPAVFFLRRPPRFGLVMLYGLVMFGMQFAFLFVGMHLGVSAGLASLALQIQAFFTILLASLWLKERPTPLQLIGCLVAAAGLVVVGVHVGGDVTLAGLACLMVAAAAWAVANLMSKAIGKVEMLALVAWGGLAAPVPLLAASLVFEGPATVLHAVTHMSPVAWGAIAYSVYPSTLVSYTIWSALLNRYPVSTVAPFTLLVPIVGIASSALVLHEQISSWKVLAAVLVLAGLMLNVFGPRLAARRLRVAATSNA